MDNAVRAIIIAATTILGVMLFSVMIYVFRQAARVDEQYDSNQAQRTLELNNSKFELFNNNFNNITNIVSLCNLAYDNNVDCSYDFAKSVRITITIKSKKYIIPDVDPALSTNSFNDKKIDDLYGKNRIWPAGGGDPIHIYDLMNKTLKELGIDSTSDDKLTKSHYGLIKFNYDKDGVYYPGGEEKTATVYKYIFRCKNDEITYNDKLGTIKSMSFELYTPDSGSELYWDTHW